MNFRISVALAGAIAVALALFVLLSDPADPLLLEQGQEPESGAQDSEELIPREASAANPKTEFADVIRESAARTTTIPLQIQARDGSALEGEAQVYYLSDQMLEDGYETPEGFHPNHPWRHQNLDFLPSVQLPADGTLPVKLSGSTGYFYAVHGSWRGMRRCSLYQDHSPGFAISLEPYESFAIQVLRSNRKPAVGVPVMFQTMRGTQVETDDSGHVYLHLPEYLTRGKQGRKQVRIADRFKVLAPLLSQQVKREVHSQAGAFQRYAFHLPPFGQVRVRNTGEQLDANLMLQLDKGARHIRVEPQLDKGNESWHFDFVPIQQPLEILLQEGDPIWEEGSLVLTGFGPRSDGKVRELDLDITKAFRFSTVLVDEKGAALPGAEICAWLVDQAGKPTGEYAKATTSAEGELELFFHPERFRLSKSKWLWMHTEMPEWSAVAQPYREFALELPAKGPRGLMDEPSLSPLKPKLLADGWVVYENGERAKDVSVRAAACLRPSDFGSEDLREQRWPRPKVLSLSAPGGAGEFALATLDRPFDCDYELRVHDQSGKMRFRQLLRKPVKDMEVVLTSLADISISYSTDGSKGPVDFFLTSFDGRKFQASPSFSSSAHLDRWVGAFEGQSSFEDLPPGIYNFQALERQGRVFADIANVAISADEPKPSQLQLIPLRAPGTLRIKLFDYEGFDLSIHNQGRRNFRVYHKGQDGFEQVDSLRAWHRDFFLRQEGYLEGHWLVVDGCRPVQLSDAFEGKRYELEQMPTVTLRTRELEQRRSRAVLWLEVKPPKGASDLNMLTLPERILPRRWFGHYEVPVVTKGTYELVWVGHRRDQGEKSAVRAPVQKIVLDPAAGSSTQEIRLPESLAQALFAEPDR